MKLAFLPSAGVAALMMLSGAVPFAAAPACLGIADVDDYCPMAGRPFADVTFHLPPLFRRLL